MENSPRVTFSAVAVFVGILGACGGVDPPSSLDSGAPSGDDMRSGTPAGNLGSPSPSSTSSSGASPVTSPVPAWNGDGSPSSRLPLQPGSGVTPASGSAGSSPGAGSGSPSRSASSPEPTDCVIPAPSPVPIGYGSATTGGGAMAPIVVNSFDEAAAALAAYRSAFKAGTRSALVLRYTGSFDFTAITDVCVQHTLPAQVLEVKEMENVTFEGAPGSSGNFGIHVNRAKNVIVRNMKLGLLPGGGDADAITIEGNGTNGDVENVWIDHNELFSSTKDDCPGAGDSEFDGLIDIKKGARRITISYNLLHDHQKTGLLGFSDGDDTERYVTFHHNWYENVVSRTPLQRFGFVHIFNNYYDQITSSGINVRMGGVALIESNFFENAVNPVTSRYSDQVGFWDLRNNHVGDGISWTTESDTSANAEDWQTTMPFPANEIDYTYTPDDAGCVKSIVMATAGAKL